MKKIFVSVLAVAMSLSVFAAETAKVTIELRSTNATYGTDVLELRENTERNSSYESGYDAESMMSQANKHSVLLYAYVGEQPCATVATNNLDGLYIGFTTNKYDTDYSLNFSNFSGRELTVLDRVTNEVFTINASAPAYAFSVEAAQVGRVAVTDRFLIGGTPVVSLCFRYNELEVLGHAGESLVIKKDDAEIVNIPSLAGAYRKDLSAYTGRLVVVLNGKEYQIDANPADLTPAN